MENIMNAMESDLAARDPLQVPSSVLNWMKPVDDTSPCGQDLEYDPEFVLLCARAEPRLEAQYGDFVGLPEPVDWGEIDRECRRLMGRSRDMRLAVLFARARIHVAGLPGLAEGLSLLAGWLEQFPGSIHPCADADTDLSLSLEIRRNVLEALVDPSGMLGDVRQVNLPESAGRRLQVREVERAHTQSGGIDALSIDSIQHYLRDMRSAHPEIVTAVQQARGGLTLIDAWSQAQLGDRVADLSVLTRILSWLDQESALGRRRSHVSEHVLPSTVKHMESTVVSSSRARAVGPIDVEHNRSVGSVGEPALRSIDRDTATQHIEDARAWFVRYEPSSPIGLLLVYAQHCIGKSYVELYKMIPEDMLVRMESVTQSSLSQ